MSFRTRSVSMLAAAVIFVAPLAGLRAEENAPKKPLAKNTQTVVGKGSKVSLEYTLSLEGGQVVETNAGKAPLNYEQGSGNMLPAFEAQVAGLKAGAAKEFDLSPEQGYGLVRKDLYQTVDAAQIPADARAVGTMLTAQAEDGRQHPVRVSEVKGDRIVLDLNHPLAGKKLHFAIKVLSVE